MCGIAGVFYFNGTRAPEPGPLRELLVRMRDSMTHRGPDGAGLWMSEDGRVGLAHRRLAIVDLSPDAAQPMSGGNGSIWVTYNGEIYNHMAIRRELEARGRRFRTDHSDTEVLVHGYAEWGIDGLIERLDGMFAFALWDAGRRLLTLVRDRVGIKPLYFNRTGGAFRFASEIKAILEDGAVARAVEPSAVNHYLSFLVAPAPLTMFREVFKLPPGHLLEVEATGRVSARRYWDAVPGRGIAADEIAGLDDAGKERFFLAGIRTRLEQAIEKRMMSDVPFGVFLSGGVDSSANTALMARLMTRPVDTFTVGFRDHARLNEIDHARRVAREFKTNHHEVLIDERDMTGYLDNLVHHQDEPIADWVCIPLYFVSKLAKASGVTVVQVGEGSDEQFSGYNSYMAYMRLNRWFYAPYARLAPAWLRKAFAASALALARAVPALERPADFLARAARGQELFWSGSHAMWNVHKERLVRKDAFRRANGWDGLADSGLDVAGLDDADSGAVIDGCLESFDRSYPDRDTLTRMIHLEFRLRLPELLLMRVDKITMSTAVEGRVPFLDRRMVEFTMDIPMHWKVKGGEPKYLLKRALKGLLPDDVIYRKKMGFAAPMAEWLRSDFGRRAEADVLASELMRDGWFDSGRVKYLFADHRTGRRDHALHLWTLFNLTTWHDHWIAGRAA